MRAIRRRRHFRWITGGGFAALAASGSAIMTFGSPPAHAAVSPGTGNAYAQALQVTPHEGSLAVGAVFGEALAGHTNTFARAQSQGVDLGAVGASLQGYNCNQPPALASLVPTPLQTETGASGADKGMTQKPSQSDYGANEYVMANSVPYGLAETTFAGPLAAPNSAFDVSGLNSRSWSGLVNGVREAGATADVGSIDIGGVVKLDGLHWEVTYPSTGTAKPTGSFTIGKATIGGNSIPTQNLGQVQDLVNQAIGTLGLQLQFPKPHSQQGVEFVPPLQVAVVPNDKRDAIVDPVLNALGPTYFQVANGLENGFGSDNAPLNSLAALEQGPNGQKLAAELCQSDTPVTVADITIAAFSGAGFFNASFGGVNATSGNLAANPYNLGSGFGGSLPGISTFVPGSAGTPGTPGSSGAALGSGSGAGSAGGGPSLASGSGGSSSGGKQASATTNPPPTQPAAKPAAVSYAAGGPLLAAGLGGLGLLGLLAEGDRRMMRRAQHAVSFEE